MAGNSIGQLFRVTTFGESHGLALGCIVDGVPPGIELTEADLQHDLDRRRPGTSRYTTQRREPDQVKILSGVFEGRTTGTSIGLLIENTDQRSQDYGAIKDVLRPGHADYTYEQKYGFRDYRGGGRSSARETAMRVAAGAIAKKYLAQKFGIVIRGCLSQMGDIPLAINDWDQVEQNPFFCSDASKLEALDELMRGLKKEGDSIGAKVTVVADGVPPGWGEPVFDRLDADIAHAMMSINAVKGVEIGDGFGVVALRGSENRDEITKDGFQSNHAGGVLGGMGDIVTLIIKPIGAINPGIILSKVLAGFFMGLILYKRPVSLKRTIFACTVTTVLCDLIITTASLFWMYGTPLEILLPWRIVNYLSLLPVNTALLFGAQKLMGRINVPVLKNRV